MAPKLFGNAHPAVPARSRQPLGKAGQPAVRPGTQTTLTRGPVGKWTAQTYYLPQSPGILVWPQEQLENQTAAGERDVRELQVASNFRGPLGYASPGGGGKGTGKTQGKVRPISTPIPSGATKQNDGSYTIDIRGVAVTINKDARSDSVAAKGAETQFNFDWPPFPELGYEYSLSGPGNLQLKITDVVPAAEKPAVTIQTNYGPNSDPTAPSAYGMGTTLQDHEGAHGTDFLNYLRKNSVPVVTTKSYAVKKNATYNLGAKYSGKIAKYHGKTWAELSQTEQAMQEAIADALASLRASADAQVGKARRQYSDKMHTDSKHNTDCRTPKDMKKRPKAQFCPK